MSESEPTARELLELLMSEMAKGLSERVKSMSDPSKSESPGDDMEDSGVPAPIHPPRGPLFGRVARELFDDDAEIGLGPW